MAEEEVAAMAEEEVAAMAEEEVVVVVVVAAAVMAAAAAVDLMDLHGLEDHSTRKTGAMSVVTGDTMHTIATNTTDPPLAGDTAIDPGLRATVAAAPHTVGPAAGRRPAAALLTREAIATPAPAAGLPGDLEALALLPHTDLPRGHQGGIPPRGPLPLVPMATSALRMEDTNEVHHDHPFISYSDDHSRFCAL